MEAQETAPATITTTLPATAAGGDLSPQSNHVDDGRFAKGNRAGLSTRFEPGTSGNPGGGKVGAAYPSRWLPALGDLSEAELNVVAKDKKASVSKRARMVNLFSRPL